MEKGILDLLETFSKLSDEYPNIELYTYGNTFDPDFMKKIQSFDNKESIFIHGKIKGKEKFQAIADADCFILPSWNEGQPLVLLEAMSQGTVIVASKVGFVPELLGEDYPFLFEAKNKKDLAQKIVQIIETPNEKWSDYLLKRFKINYSNRSHSEKLVNIFSSI